MRDDSERPGPITARRKKRNWPLILGTAIVTVLVALAVFGPSFAPHNPMVTYPILQDETGEWHTHPLSPGEMDDFVLGTDYDRRDILSRLLWAFRPTLTIALLAAALRIVTGTIIGLVGGWFGGRVHAVASALTTAAITVPILIVALLLLYIFGRQRTVFHFVVALSVTGWAATAQIIMVRVRTLRGANYMEASRSVGAGEAHILRRHVLPQLSNLLPVVASFDIAAVLLAVAELGFVGLFLGSGAFRAIPKGNTPDSYFKLVPGQPELSQMLSVGWDNIFQTPWLALWAGAAFFVAVLGFTLVGEGLKRRYGELRRPTSGQRLVALPELRTLSATIPRLQFTGREWAAIALTALVSATLAAGTSLAVLAYLNEGQLQFQHQDVGIEAGPASSDVSPGPTEPFPTPTEPFPTPTLRIRAEP